MSVVQLLHGTDHIIEAPSLTLGKGTNDYGKGFYCTLLPEMAKEWACKNNTDGFVNEYEFNDDGLNVLNLLDGEHTILNWIALLLEHRIFTVQDEIAKDAKTVYIRKSVIDRFETSIIALDFDKSAEDDVFACYVKNYNHPKRYK